MIVPKSLVGELTQKCIVGSSIVAANQVYRALCSHKSFARQQPFSQIFTRSLSLHEYQSKSLLERYGINVQSGKEADTPDEAYEVARKLFNKGHSQVVVKCQVLAGGRGKGLLSSGLKGGVKLVASAEEARYISKQMLGYRLVTQQTTEEGELVKKVFVVSAADIEKELYLAFVMDRNSGGPVAIVSQMGGVDIEEVALTRPDAVKHFPIDIKLGMLKGTALDIVTALGYSHTNEAELSLCAEQITRLYNLFIRTDATQIEINPLAVLKSKDKNIPQAPAFLDAKLSFDDNASFRQKQLFEQEDLDVRDPRELQAERSGLNFVGLTGNVGCLVNGAGLAMSTMDIIKLHGGEPANFLDVGGGADEGQVTEAFRILKSDPNVKVIFVNIFGGIMKCDTIAKGLLEAARIVDLKLPLVVRLVGNRVEIGKQIIEDAVSEHRSLDIKVIDDFRQAAEEVVRLSNVV